MDDNNRSGVIEKDSPVPVYRQVEEHLKQSIASGYLQACQRMPSTRELCRQFDISTTTAVLALKSLVNDGFAYTVQGKGTFVADRKKDRPVIGLVIPHLILNKDVEMARYDAKHFVPLVHFIEDEARKSGADILLCLDNDSPENEKENILKLLQRGVDGIIIYYIGGESNLKYIRQIKAAGIPLVLIDRSIDGIDVDYVTTDNFSGAYKATRFLLESRCPADYYLFTNAEKCNANTERERGFQRALLDSGQAILGSSIKSASCYTNLEDIEYNARYDEEIYCLAKTLAGKNRDVPLGIFAINSPILVGVWEALKEMRINRSKLTLACFDEPPLAIPEEVPFAIVLQPLEEIGRQSVRIVTEKLAGEKEIQRIVLPPVVKVVNEGRALPI